MGKFGAEICRKARRCKDQFKRTLLGGDSCGKSGESSVFDLGFENWVGHGTGEDAGGRAFQEKEQ